MCPYAEGPFSPPSSAKRVATCNKKQPPVRYLHSLHLTLLCYVMSAVAMPGSGQIDVALLQSLRLSMPWKQAAPSAQQSLDALFNISMLQVCSVDEIRLTWAVMSHRRSGKQRLHNSKPVWSMQRQNRPGLQLNRPMWNKQWLLGRVAQKHQCLLIHIVVCCLHARKRMDSCETQVRMVLAGAPATRMRSNLPSPE